MAEQSRTTPFTSRISRLTRPETTLQQSRAGAAAEMLAAFLSSDEELDIPPAPTLGAQRRYGYTGYQLGRRAGYEEPQSVTEPKAFGVSRYIEDKPGQQFIATPGGYVRPNSADIPWTPRAEDPLRDFRNRQDIISAQFELWNAQQADAALLAQRAADEARADLFRDFTRGQQDIDLQRRQMQESANQELGRLYQLQANAREQYGFESQFLADSIRRAEETFQLRMQELNMASARMNESMLDSLQLGSDLIASQEALAVAQAGRNKSVADEIRAAKGAAERIEVDGVRQVAEEGQAEAEAAFQRARVEGATPQEQAALDAITNEAGELLVDAAGIVGTNALDLLKQGKEVAIADIEQLASEDQFNAYAQRVLTEAENYLTNKGVAEGIESLQEAMEQVENQKDQERLNFKHFRELAEEDQTRMDFEFRVTLEGLMYQQNQIGLDVRHAMERLGIGAIRNEEDYNNAIARLTAEYGTDTLGAEEFGLDVAVSALERRLGDNVDRFVLGRYTSAFTTLLQDGVVSLESLLEKREIDLESEEPQLTSTEWGYLVDMMNAYVDGRDAYNNTLGYGEAPQTFFDTLPLGSNGRLRDSDLVSIGAGHRMAPPAASAFRSMSAAAALEGVDLFAGMTDSYRSLEAQIRCVEEKGLYSEGGKNGYRGCAAPGTSNHGLGLALDIGGSAAQAWLRNNGARFGFYTIADEPWHWEFRGLPGGERIDTSAHYNPVPTSYDKPMSATELATPVLPTGVSFQ